jgi:hypothetical protein
VEQFNYSKLNHEAGRVRLLMDVDGVESEAPSDFLEGLIALGSRGLEAEALGWRQIETAPKDARRIFGLLERHRGHTKVRDQNHLSPRPRRNSRGMGHRLRNACRLHA